MEYEARDRQVQQTYRVALDSFIERVRQDNHILAAIVGGSLSYDEVWEKSDIDVWLVSDDEKKPSNSFDLVEHGIHFSTAVISRMEFKKSYEKSRQGGFVHSFLSKSTLLFCKDDAIQDYFEQNRRVGERDADLQLFAIASHAVPIFEKAEKWIVIKRDVAYSFIYIMRLVEQLAQIEVLLHRDIPTREVIQQALAYNPTFFRAMYTDLIFQPKDEQTITQALALADAYLVDRKAELFKPVFAYLTAANDVRTLSEMKEKNQFEDIALVCALEWLAHKGFVQRASGSVRLTTKSRVEVDELAYFL